jgi:hypothetical protein
MNNTTKQLFVAGLFAFALSLNAQAAITYVDAAEGSLGNTFATGGSLGVTTWQRSVTTNDDDQWGRRTDSDTNGATLFQGYSNLAGGGSIPELTTQITLLDPGNYNVWVFFWDASGTNKWNIAAGLTSGSTATYSFDGLGTTNQTVAASTLSFTTGITTVGLTDRILYGVNLGQATASGGSINVFIDSLEAASSGANRTWYDGVGFEAVAVPEPSSMALLGLGGLALILRRRR